MTPDTLESKLPATLQLKPLELRRLITCQPGHQCAVDETPPRSQAWQTGLTQHVNVSFDIVCTHWEWVWRGVSTWANISTSGWCWLCCSASKRRHVPLRHIDTRGPAPRDTECGGLPCEILGVASPRCVSRVVIYCIAVLYTALWAKRGAPYYCMSREGPSRSIAVYTCCSFSGYGSG